MGRTVPLGGSPKIQGPITGEQNLSLRVGVIGLGHWGPNLVRNFSSNPRVDVVAVCDARPEAFENLGATIGADFKRCSDIRDIIGDPDIDAVVIVTPASSHAEIARQALEAGKHVFCEKPLAFDGETILALDRTAKENDVQLMIGYTFLFNAGILKLRDLMCSDRLGKLYYMKATRTHMGLVRQDVNVVWDLAAHDVAIMNFLLGERPDKVSVVGSNPLGTENSDVAFISLQYPSGVLGQIHVSWVDANKLRTMELVGSKARAIFDDLNNLEPVRLFEKGIGVADTIEPDFGAFRYLINDGDIISPKVHVVEPLRCETDAFVDLILDGKPNPASAVFAADVSAVLSAGDKSSANNSALQTVN